jgi:hypothetical protein
VWTLLLKKKKKKMVTSYQAGAKLDVAEEEPDAHDRREAGSGVK